MREVKQALVNAWCPLSYPAPGRVWRVSCALPGRVSLQQLPCDTRSSLCIESHPHVCVHCPSATQLCIALGMAELASAYPTSGGMYYYQFRLSGRRVGPFACWITGERGLCWSLGGSEALRGGGGAAAAAGTVGEPLDPGVILQCAASSL